MSDTATFTITIDLDVENAPRRVFERLSKEMIRSGDFDSEAVLYGLQGAYANILAAFPQTTQTAALLQLGEQLEQARRKPSHTETQAPDPDESDMSDDSSESAPTEAELLLVAEALAQALTRCVLASELGK